MPAVDHWWVCSPLGLVADALGVLDELEVSRSRIHRELFYVGDEPPRRVHHADADTGPGAAVMAVSTAATSSASRRACPIRRAQQARADLRSRARAGSALPNASPGRVTMRRNYALEDSELAAGYVLTCQSLPVTDAVTVSYDS
jgi:ring-1,2-phenylacetyl-CoA epoxidase subunit PaaE